MEFISILVLICSLSISLSKPSPMFIFDGSFKYQTPQQKPTIVSLECKPTQADYNGKCFQILQEYPCGDGKWLVEDPVTGKGQCVPNKCANYSNSGFYKDACVQIRSEEQCPKGMRMYIYKSGVVDCDCKEGHIYNVQDGFCYEAYRQGPCKQGMVFISTSTDGNNNNGTTKTMCKTNSCKTDGYYCNGPDSKCEQKGFVWRLNPKYYYNLIRFPKSGSESLTKNCIKFGSSCTSEGQGIFIVHPETNQPYCQIDLHDTSFETSNTRIIGNVPILKCSKGSRRDILGNCRTPTIINFS